MGKSTWFSRNEALFTTCLEPVFEDDVLYEKSVCSLTRQDLWGSQQWRIRLWFIRVFVDGELCRWKQWLGQCPAPGALLLCPSCLRLGGREVEKSSNKGGTTSVWGMCKYTNALQAKERDKWEEIWENRWNWVSRGRGDRTGRVLFLAGKNQGALSERSGWQGQDRGGSAHNTNWDCGRHITIQETTEHLRGEGIPQELSAEMEPLRRSLDYREV